MSLGRLAALFVLIGLVLLGLALAHVMLLPILEPGPDGRGDPGYLLWAWSRAGLWLGSMAMFALAVLIAAGKIVRAALRRD